MRGRPKKNPDDRRVYGYRILMTKEEFDELKDISEQLNVHKSIIIREGIKLIKEKYYAKSENGNE